MPKKEGIETIKKKILPILKKNKVSKAGIFGSYARGDYNSKSNVDILVKVDDDMGIIGFIELKSKLEEILDKKVDLVEYKSIKPEIRNIILKDEVSILA